MHVETTIDTALKKICGFYQDASDITLKFMKMTPATRDSLMSCAIDIEPTHNLKYVGFVFDAEKKHITIQYGQNAKSVTLNPMTKTIGHEIGHVDYLLAGKTDFNRKTLYSLPYHLIHNGTSDPSKLYQAATVLSAVVGSPYPIGSAIAVATITGYPYRVMERYADNISHKLLPEFGYLETLDAFNQDEENVLSIEKSILKLRRCAQRSPIGSLLLPLNPDHPSDYSRNKMCQAVRPIYLAQKQQLGIPSLYVPQ